MSARRELTVRDIDFEFSDDIPFFFNPGNMAWSKFCNSLGSMAIHFERYVIHAARQAEPLIRDEQLKQEAKLFIQQEAVHSKHHRNHLKWLLARAPELAETDKIIADYFAPFYQKPFRFQLAYAANVEAMMAPAMNFIVENRDALFGGGDSRISSFILWHFIEEIEHKNSALDIYNHVVGSYFYRIASMPLIVLHFLSAINKAVKPFSEIEQRETGVRTPLLKAFKYIGWRSKMRFLFQLVCTVLPFHNPEHFAIPRWAQTWFEDEENGVDMRMYYRG